jgi:hypothetical protein
MEATLRTSVYFRTSPTKYRLCSFCPTLLIRLLYFLFGAIKPVSLQMPCRAHVLVWIIHLLGDHVRWQARRLTLSNNLTPKSTRTCIKVNPGSLPLNAVSQKLRESKKRQGRSEPLPIRNVSRCTKIPVPIPQTHTPSRERTTPR